MRLGAFLSPGADLRAAIDLARRAEDVGYESVWVTHGVGRDSFLVLAAYAAAATRIAVGNGVVPIYPRHPIAMAQSALTLSEVTGGRFRLGIGVSHRSSMESMLGLDLTRPLGVMREYVQVLRGAFGSGASFEGKFYRVKWSYGVPARPPAPPIYLAALSSRMCELAGEIADGAILWLCPPAYVRDRREALRPMGHWAGPRDTPGEIPHRSTLRRRVLVHRLRWDACARLGEYQHVHLTPPPSDSVTAPLGGIAA